MLYRRFNLPRYVIPRMTTCRIYRAELAERDARYDNMLVEVRLPWCWACGRGERDRPSDWHAPWLIHRAHIAWKPRRRDRRAVILLCPLCHHGGAHGERIVTSSREFQWPRLEREHMLWIKLHRDREFYEREFLQSSMIGRLPKPQKPPAVYLREYERRHGILVSRIET
jgi:hypothetical protein